MTPLSSPQVATISAAAARLLTLERIYGVSLGVWLSLDGDGEQDVYWNVHVNGSGAAFDRMPVRLGTSKARIVSAFPDPLGAALAECLDRLATALQRYSEPTPDPPA